LFVFLALPPTCGNNKSTPNGAFLSFQTFFDFGDLAAEEAGGDEGYIG